MDKNKPFTPIYTTVDNVKVRLANKVQFQTSTEELLDGQLPDALLLQLIVDAETAVEQKLRSRYAIPFQARNGALFGTLPDHSQRAIRRAVDMACLMEILRTDFGRGGHIDADKYFESTEEIFTKYIKELLGRDDEGASEKHDRYRFSPPLDGVRLARNNREADDGYKGKIINTDGSRHGIEDYAKERINNPSQTFLSKKGWGGL